MIFYFLYFFYFKAKNEKKQNVDVPLEPKDVAITKPIMKNSRSVNQGRKKTKHHIVSVKLTGSVLIVRINVLNT